MSRGDRGLRGGTLVALGSVVCLLGGCGASGSGPTTPTPSTPTPAPTATPTPAAAQPGIAEVVAQSGNTGSCLGSVVAAPGNYVSIQATGTLAAGTFASGPTVSGTTTNSYSVTAVTLPTPNPAPTPTPTSTPAPPAPSGTNPPGLAATLYLGSYSVPAFVAPYTANATAGCFALQAPVNGTAASASGAFVAAPATFQTAIGGGTITTLSIQGVTASSGSGTFVLDNGVVGSVTLTGSEQLIIYGDPAAAITSLLRNSPPRR